MAELTVAQAAAQLGLSVDTVKRRAQKGKLPARQDDRGRWLVTLDTPEAPTPLETAALRADLETLRADLTNARGLLAATERHRETLQAQVDRLHAELTEAHTNAAELRRLMGAQLQALAAPRTDTPETPATAPQEQRTGWRWPWQR